MPERQSLSSIVPLAAIERPACPQCKKQMMLARIVPALLGTVLYTFECAACNHVLRTLAASMNTEKPKDAKPDDPTPKDVTPKDLTPKDLTPNDLTLPTLGRIVEA